MVSYVSVKNKDGKYKSYKVNENVAIYVKQLELAIRFPEKSKLREAYPERFGNAIIELQIDQRDLIISNMSEDEEIIAETENLITIGKKKSWISKVFGGDNG